MAVAAYSIVPEMVSFGAGVFRGRGKNPFLQADEAVDQLEYGARRVKRLDCTVEHGLGRVGYHFIVMASDVRQLSYFYAGARNEGEYLARRRLYGHDTAPFAVHQFFAVLLQITVDGGFDVVSRDCGPVVFPVLVGRFDFVVCVSQVDFVPLLPPEDVFISAFYAGFPRVIPRFVFAFMSFYIVRVHFGNIAEKASPGFERIFPDCACLPVESGEPVFLLCKQGVSFLCQFFHEDNGTEAYASAVFPVFLHPFPDESRFHVQDFGQGKGVECPCFARCHHQVIRHVVAYQYLAVTVVDEASRRVDYRIYEGVVVGIDFIFVVYYLYPEKFAEKYGCGHDYAYRKPGMAAHACAVVLHFVFDGFRTACQSNM